jgi:hypoxanthine-guanine phosphoribosyltransferase
MAVSILMGQAHGRRPPGPASPDLKEEIRERDVLLVEDIVDSGFTIASVIELLSLGILAMAVRFIR